MVDNSFLLCPSKQFESDQSEACYSDWWNWSSMGALQSPTDIYPTSLNCASEFDFSRKRYASDKEGGDWQQWKKPRTMDEWPMESIYNSAKMSYQNEEVLQIIPAIEELFQNERLINRSNYESFRDECRGIHESMIHELKSLTEAALLLSGPNPKKNSIGCPDGNLPLIRFPLVDEEDLDSFEDWLASTENFDQAFALFTKIGGSSVGKIIRNILRKLFTDQLASQHTLVGRNGKLRFKDLRCYQLLIDSSRIHGMLRSTSNSEIDSHISDWLRTSSSRIRQSKPLLSRNCNSPLPQPDSSDSNKIGSTSN